MKKNNDLGLVISSIVIGLLVLPLAIRIILKDYSGKTKNFFINEIKGFCVNDVCLSKDNDNYFVEYKGVKVPADNEKVINFIKLISKIKLEELVSTNPERFKELGFDDQKVILKVDKQELEIGGMNPSFDGTLVKDNNKIYSILLILNKVNLSSFEYWQIKQLTNLPKLEIIKISAKTPRNTIIVKDNKIIDRISNLPVVKYLPVITIDEKNIYSYLIEIRDNSKTIYLGRGKVNGKNVYWASTDRTYYYEILANDFNLLTAKIK
ncbi:MAG TPA: DUF4340 domain-containing protein [Candidatus Woesebacteria bacterium]|nr:DUF4340 domain-containing protein [Candidatus Woesebacteria bacterium]HPJ16904.1 DUF4340 domain-containing protein [Candidatus Woesebacteria bacterium]